VLYKEKMTGSAPSLELGRARFYQCRLAGQLT